MIIQSMKEVSEIWLRPEFDSHIYILEVKVKGLVPGFPIHILWTSGKNVQDGIELKYIVNGWVWHRIIRWAVSSIVSPSGIRLDTWYRFTSLASDPPSLEITWLLHRPVLWEGTSTNACSLLNLYPFWRHYVLNAFSLYHLSRGYAFLTHTDWALQDPFHWWVCGL